MEAASSCFSLCPHRVTLMYYPNTIVCKISKVGSMFTRSRCRSDRPEAGESSYHIHIQNMHLSRYVGDIYCIRAEYYLHQCVRYIAIFSSWSVLTSQYAPDHSAHPEAFSHAADQVAFFGHQKGMGVDGVVSSTHTSYPTTNGCQHQCLECCSQLQLTTPIEWPPAATAAQLRTGIFVS